MTLIATSRFLISHWQGEHLPLTHASYGDFLQKIGFLKTNGYRLRREQYPLLYRTLGGNVRWLEWTLAALASFTNPDDESAFLIRLTEAQQQMIEDIAIETIYEHLPPLAAALLAHYVVGMTGLGSS